VTVARLRGVAARRALARWGLRSFRREWRQQVLVVTLLTVGTAAAVFASAAAHNVARPPEGQFGSAGRRIELSVREPDRLEGYLAAAHEHFGVVEVIGRRSAPVPGSVDSVEVRSQDPSGEFGTPMLGLRSGRYPATAGEVALTDRAAVLFAVTVGDTIPLDGDRPTVVGLVENPADLDDEFVLVTPSTASPPARVTFLFDATDASVDTFRPATEPGPLFIDDARDDDQTVFTVIAFTIATIGMLLVGLVASAGFVVIAQRRQRQLGMLAATGATPRHVRMVVVTNGVLAGSVAAVAGVGIGLAAWMLAAPALEGMAGHRIGRFDLPSWLIVGGAALAVTTAAASAWWPARTVARVPIVAALSARPPRRGAPRRSAAAAVVVLAAGIVCLGVGVDPTRDRVNGLLLIAGVVATVVAAVLLAAPSIAFSAAHAGRLPVGPRLAVRDLGRNLARSGAALAAITVGLAIAVSVIVVTAAAEHGAGEGNLSDRQLIAWVGSTGPDIRVPDRPAEDIDRSRAAVEGFAATLEEVTVVTLEVAVDPTITERRDTDLVRPLVSLGRPVGEDTLRFSAILYLATPELLQHLGIPPETIDPETILLTDQHEPAHIVGDIADNPFRRGPVPADEVAPIDTPPYSSAPRALITEKGAEAGGFERTTAGWLIESDQPLSHAQLAAARDMAADAGVVIEARDQQPGLLTIRTAASVTGVLLALGILAMTVGLLRAERTSELRTLTAAGATSRVRRALTATTAAVLAALATVLGTLISYLALAAGYWPDLDRLANIPLAHLLAITVAVPTTAAVAGWLLANREPPAIARQPIE